MLSRPGREQEVVDGLQPRPGRLCCALAAARRPLVAPLLSVASSRDARDSQRLQVHAVACDPRHLHRPASAAVATIISHTQVLKRCSRCKPSSGQSSMARL